MPVSRRTVLIGVGALIALPLLAGGGLVLAVLAQPPAYDVQRSIHIQAPPQAVWPHIDDYRAFVEWSPWSDRDPDQISTFSDPSQGVGAWYRWNGNSDVGSGEMRTTHSEPPAVLRQDLSFMEPIQADAKVTFELSPSDGGTKVVWRTVGDLDFMGRAFTLVMSFDDMLGGDFETGLGRLKDRVEAQVMAEHAEAAARAAEAPPQGRGDGAEPEVE